MDRNLMPEIMKMLGVEYGEKFQLESKGNLFCFNENNGLLMLYPDGVVCGANELVYGILCGYYEIVKLPWMPKAGNVYWTIMFTSDDKPSAQRLVWSGDSIDFIKKALGLVYRTKEEAEANLSKDYERLTGKPLSSR